MFQISVWKWVEVFRVAMTLGHKDIISKPVPPYYDVLPLVKLSVCFDMSVQCIPSIKLLLAYGT